MLIQCKRVYDPPEPTDGARFLVDRLWPRGMKKDSVHLDGWLKDVVPSDALRRWFKYDAAKWPEFRRRYFAELGQHPEELEPILKATARGPVALLFSAKDAERNNAVALAEYLNLHHAPSRASKR